MISSIFSCVCWPSVCILWRNVYLGLLPIFWLDCLFSWYWAPWAIYIFWRLIPCQLLFFANIISHSEGCPFIFMVSFVVKKLLNISSSICLFLFYFHFSRNWVKKYLAVIYIKEFSACEFSSLNFIMSGLTVRSLIHFEFIFLYNVRQCSNFILLHVQFSQYHLLNLFNFLF